MSRSVLYMSMSLDGYIAGLNDRPGNPGGDDSCGSMIGTASCRRVGQTTETVDPEGMGARFLERRSRDRGCPLRPNTAEQTDHWGGDHHDGVPIFVVSHRPPGPSAAKYPLVTYVTDGIVSAMDQAKAAAGDRNVLVHGAYTAQAALAAGVLDELQIHQIPLLFGNGRRLFEVLARGSSLRLCRSSTPRKPRISDIGRVEIAPPNLSGQQVMPLPPVVDFLVGPHALVLSSGGRDAGGRSTRWGERAALIGV